MGNKKHKDENVRNWEGNIRDQFQKLLDIDVNMAHQTPLARLLQQKSQIDNFNKNVTRKSMIRYLTIIIDMSKASLKMDMRPNRAMVTKDLLTTFMKEFTD